MYLHIRSEIKGLAKKWREQYKGKDGWRFLLLGSSEKIYNDLLKCGDDLDACDKAIGTDSWTRFWCDICHEYQSRVVELTELEDCMHMICEKCARDVVKMFEV